MDLSGQDLDNVTRTILGEAGPSVTPASMAAVASVISTDWPVIQALTRAADRGVGVRIYLDGEQLSEREPAKVFNYLAETPGVEIRIKHKARDPMHLKSYQIDGRFLRTGARELVRIRT